MIMKEERISIFMKAIAAIGYSSHVSVDCLTEGRPLTAVPPSPPPSPGSGLRTITSIATRMRISLEPNIRQIIHFFTTGIGLNF